jgi:uncharacterized protein (TIGR00269 family)
MFHPREKVIVGLSGGKDSLVLLYNVMKLQQRYPKSPEIEAILIDEGIKGYREESTSIAKKMCDVWNIKLHIVDFKTYFGLELDRIIPKLKNLKINACTICGTVRRRLLNMKSLELNGDKLAIGHNLDDQVETFLQNILRNDLNKIVINPPNGNPIDDRKKFVSRIKPLMSIPEEEIVRYCYYKEFPIQSNPCPYSIGFSILRKKVQDFVNHLELHSPEIKYNLQKANENFVSNYKPKNLSNNFSDSKINKTQYQICPNCSNPMGLLRKICYYCELKEKII